ncbi:MAG: response regulator transcription factor [Granulosicoccus sp.]|nr:response regulator transcription factor [Granulosicoccus sp.]
MIKVLIADDHALVRTGFRLLLEEADDIEVIAEAESGEEAYDLFGSCEPDVVMMDIAMPGIGGIESIKKIIGRDKSARILALSVHEDISHPRRVLQAGALGYLTKRQAPEVLIDAIRKIADRQTLIDPELAQRMALAEASGESNPLESLSEREFEVFEKLALGQTVGTIAETLSLSPSTVGTHLYNLKQKLGVTNQAEITLIAVRHGVIEP